MVEATDEEDYEILLRSEEMINPVSFESTRRKHVKSGVKIRPLELRKSPRLMSVREENKEVLDCEDLKLSEDSLKIGTSEKMVDGDSFEGITKKQVRSGMEVRPVVQKKSPRLMSIPEEHEETIRVEKAEIFEEEERVEEQEFQMRNVDDDCDDETELEQSPPKKRPRKIRATKIQRMNKRKAPPQVF